MKEFQNSKFKTQNLLVVFILFFICFITFIPSPALALDSTPSADIKAKLKALEAEIASKAAQLKSEINKKLQNKAFVGAVTEKNDKTIFLDAKGKAKKILVNQDTVFGNNQKKTKGYSLKLLDKNDYISALGDIDDTGTLVAKKVILLDTPEKPSKKVIWGQIVAISDQIITLKDRDSNNLALSINSETDLKSEDSDITLSKLKPGSFIIAVGILNKNNIIKADFINLLQNGVILKPKKSSSPSATINQEAGSSGKITTTPAKTNL